MSGWRYLAVFRMLMTGLVAVVQCFFYLKVTQYLESNHKPAWMKTLTKVVFVVFNLPMVITLLWRPDVVSLPEWFMVVAVYPFYVWHYSLLFLFLFIAAGRLLQLPFLFLASLWKGISRKKNESRNVPNDRVDPTRRRILRQGVAVLAGAAFATTTLGIIRNNRFEISHVDVPISNLPDELQGFTIGLLSDIHSSIFMTRSQMEEYAVALNSLNANMVAIVGDFVNSMVEEVYPVAEAFSTLKASRGVYGVLGNHDYFTKNVEIVAREVNSCGIKLLRNDRVTIEHNGKKLDLVGIDDLGNPLHAGRLIAKQVAGADQNNPRILMAHRPYFFSQAAEQNIHLTLSGHTHGGQIVFARIDGDVIAPARMVSPYVAGLYSMGSSHMYVSRGIGTVGVPIRINCPPELTKISLVKA